MTSIDKRPNDLVETDSEQAAQPDTPADSETYVRIAVEVALNLKAERLLVLDLDAVSDFTARFLICSGTNERQVQAIADTVVKKLRNEGLRPLHAEGLRHGRWVLLDYGGEMVIHIFLEEARDFYALERLWSDAPEITERFVS